jgi:hypothetical protein
MPNNPDLKETVEIRDLPIFEAGSYPQGDFDAATLQSLADAYDPSFHEAPVYLDHEDDAGQRPAGPLAFGWIKRLYVKGQTLFADLAQVPKQFADLILAGRIKKRSVELYPDLEGKGPYLRALAWPMIPQIKGLADLHPNQIFSDKTNKFVSISFNEKEPEMPEPDFITRDELKLTLETLKTDLLAELKSLQAVSDVKTFCEQMVLAGKMTPAERATEEPLLLSQLQREHSTNFSESLTAQRMDYYRTRNSVIPLNSSANSTGEKPEHQKLVHYFNENKAFFEKMNVTLGDLIAADQTTETNPLTM